jgi:hypothetical protein
MNFQNYLPLSGRTSAARFNNPGISEGIIKRVSLVQSDRQLKYHFLGLTDITSRVQLASEEIQLPAIVHDQPCQHRLFNNFPSNSNFYTFGYLNSILRDLFADPFSLSEQERIPKLREWWINKRSKSKTKAIHIVFNLDESQNAQPEALGLSGATIVSAAVADALFSFNNKHFPNSSIGWLIGVNKTQRHSNWHILLFPETSSGEQIYISNNILSREQ